MKMPYVIVYDEIVLPGGPHECILGTETSPGYDILDWYNPFEVTGTLTCEFDSLALYEAFARCIEPSKE